MHTKKKKCAHKIIAIDSLDKPLPCLRIWSIEPCKTLHKKPFQMLENDREKLGICTLWMLRNVEVKGVF